MVQDKETQFPNVKTELNFETSLTESEHNNNYDEIFLRVIYFHCIYYISSRSRLLPTSWVASQLTMDDLCIVQTLNQS